MPLVACHFWPKERGGAGGNVLYVVEMEWLVWLVAAPSSETICILAVISFSGF